jgi:hypothetical protein
MSLPSPAKLGASLSGSACPPCVLTQITTGRSGDGQTRAAATNSDGRTRDSDVHFGLSTMSAGILSPEPNPNYPGENIPESMGEDLSESMGDNIPE